MTPFYNHFDALCSRNAFDTESLAILLVCKTAYAEASQILDTNSLFVFDLVVEHGSDRPVPTGRRRDLRCLDKASEICFIIGDPNHRYYIPGGWTPRQFHYILGLSGAPETFESILAGHYI